MSLLLANEQKHDQIKGYGRHEIDPELATQVHYGNLLLVVDFSSRLGISRGGKEVENDVYTEQRIYKIVGIDPNRRQCGLLHKSDLKWHCKASVYGQYHNDNVPPYSVRVIHLYHILLIQPLHLQGFSLNGSELLR